MKKTSFALQWWFVALEILVLFIAFLAYFVDLLLFLNVLLIFFILLFLTLKAAFPEKFEKIKEARIKKLKEKNAPREFKHKRKPAPVVYAKKPTQYNLPNLSLCLAEFSFPQAKNFRGFKRIYLSIGIYEPVLKDLAMLKALRPNFDLTGASITLKQFHFGIQVFVDGFHVGTFWNDSDSSPSNYRTVAEGKVEEAYVSISQKDNGRYSGWLFVLFKPF